MRIGVLTGGRPAGHSRHAAQLARRSLQRRDHAGEFCGLFSLFSSARAARRAASMRWVR
jgi:hypothetical protein